jgi:hypothetical protein
LGAITISAASATRKTIRIGSPSMPSSLSMNDRRRTGWV